MGNKNSTIVPINNECPICLEQTSNLITLSCGHSFDIYCLQMSFSDYFIKYQSEHNCPYCRQKIENKKLQLILKENICINLRPSEWIDKCTVRNFHYLKIKKITKIMINNSLSVLLFSYKEKKLFFISPELYNINIHYIDDIILLMKKNKNNVTEYNEELPIYNICLTSNTDSNKWFSFLNNIYFNYMKDSKIDNFKKQYFKSRDKMYFYIRNRNDIISYDYQYGEMIKGLVIKRFRKYQILFKTYMVSHNNFKYLINEMYGILYL